MASAYEPPGIRSPKAAASAPAGRSQSRNLPSPRRSTANRGRSNSAALVARPERVQPAHEVRLGRDGQLRVSVEHDPEQRGPERASPTTNGNAGSASGGVGGTGRYHSHPSPPTGAPPCPRNIPTPPRRPPRRTRRRPDPSAWSR